ncbi:APC family permease [Acidocella aromatica]|uniref:Amino acid transporter n=1 Tax=Acidocella aromatica TaxID=1303579 RepID=A0A840VDI3_9PROT|nr:APC family permease [Acidocella aromatica]MBB5373764.1 amino acid transporter [Acidocella aromatica]
MTAITRSGERLQRDSLGLSQIVAATLANIAPAMSFFFGFGLIASGAGVGAPLTILTAMVVVLFLTNTLAEFSKYRPSTGSFVTFIGMGFGPSAGAAASLFVVTGYCIAAASVVVISGGWAASTLQIFLGINIPWQVLSVAVTVIVGVLVSRGISLSTTWAAIFFYFELGLLLIGAVIMLVVNRHDISMAPLMLSSVTGGWKGIGLGFPLAIYLFIGWENSAMLAEETTNPRRNVPRALVIGTLSIGILYMFLAFATETAFHNNLQAITSSSIPFVDAFKVSAAGLLLIAYLAGVTSIFSSLIGLTNAQARILFSSSREGLLPPFFGKIHPQHKTPHAAMWVYILAALAIVLVFGYIYDIDPVTLFGDTGTLGTIPVVVTYLLTNLALPIYMYRYHREDFSAVRHFIVPLVGTGLMLFPLWGLVEPGQPYPFSLYPKLAIGLFVFSLVYGIILAKRNPDLVHRIGSYVADEEY